MKKYRLDGPFSRSEVEEFVEDIANTDNYYITQLEVNQTLSGLFYVGVLYEIGEVAKTTKTSKTKTKKGSE